MSRLGSRSIGFAFVSSWIAVGCGAEVPNSTEEDGSTSGLGASTGASTSFTTDVTTTIDPSLTVGESTAMMESSSTGPEPAECGNGIVEGGEDCDGTELGGQDCVSQGFDLGDLGCQADCVFDHGGCAFAGCGNGILEGTEVCDKNTGDETCITQGFDSGTLACGEYCLSFDTAGCGMCGNGVIDGAEACDGEEVAGESCESLGFDSGTLGCAADCSGVDPAVCGTCGDAILDAEETCDSDLLGGETCESLGLVGGDLACSALCGYDVVGCDIPGLPFGSDNGYSGYYLDPPSLPCEDISDTGTATGLSDDDVIEVPIGFTFTFYGTGFDNAAIQSNGVLRFGDASYLDYFSTCLPSGTVPDTHNIYAVWDDLNPGDGFGAVYYETLGVAGDQVFIAQWDTNFYSNVVNDTIRFQVMLSEATGQIIVCYPDMDSAMATGTSGAEATAGVQEDSANALEFSCSTPDLTTGRQLLYIPL